MHIGYNKNDIDYYFLYNSVLDEGYLASIENTENKNIVIRTKLKTKNEQVRNINFSKDYLFENVINNIF